MTAFLGRDRYERAAASEDPRVGMRNGYCLTTVIILSRESERVLPGPRSSSTLVASTEVVYDPPLTGGLS